MVNLSGEIGKRFILGYLESHSLYANRLILHVPAEVDMAQYGMKSGPDRMNCEPSCLLAYPNPDPDDLILALHGLSLSCEIARLDSADGHLHITILPSTDGTTNIDADIIEGIVSARRKVMDI